MAIDRSFIKIGFSQFFDRPAVQYAVDRATRGVLMKAGAFVRRRARSSIRKRKKVSEPGRPPNSHTGLLKNRIFFGYDPRAESVVVGPQATNQVFFGGDGRPVRGMVPEVLEFGGEINILEVYDPIHAWAVERGLARGRDGWRRADLRSRRRLAGKRTRMRKVRIRARPYMNPALEAEAPNFANLWRNSVRPAA